MLFFKCRNEGEMCEQGFNFYRFSDKASIGFILIIYKLKINIRYSKHLEKWIVHAGLRPNN